MFGEGEWGGGSCDFVVLASHANLLCRCVCSFLLSGDSGSGPILLSSLTCPALDIYSVSPSSLIFFFDAIYPFSFRCSISLPYLDGFYPKSKQVVMTLA